MPCLLECCATKSSFWDIYHYYRSRHTMAQFRLPAVPLTHHCYQPCWGMSQVTSHHSTFSAFFIWNNRPWGQCPKGHTPICQILISIQKFVSFNDLSSYIKFFCQYSLYPSFVAYLARFFEPSQSFFDLLHRNLGGLQPNHSSLLNRIPLKYTNAVRLNLI